MARERGSATGKMHDARCRAGRWVGGVAVAGRSGGAAPFWSASRLVRFVQLADLAPYTQAS